MYAQMSKTEIDAASFISRIKFSSIDSIYILFVYLIVKVFYLTNLHMYSYICFTRGNISSRFNRKYSIRLEDGHVPLMLAQDFTVFYNGQWIKIFCYFKAFLKNLLVKRKKLVLWRVKQFLYLCLIVCSLHFKMILK